MVRIGQGFDIHRVVPDRPLMLGGVHIPCAFGLLGHSDADVLLHAITDALLGALALGDLGQWFPNTDERYRGIASARLLEAVLRSPQAQGWTLVNLDTTILAERPKLAPHVPAIRDSLATIFAADKGCISVKAATMEGVDSIGRGEAIAAQAVLLIARDAPPLTPSSL